MRRRSMSSIVFLVSVFLVLCRAGPVLKTRQLCSFSLKSDKAINIRWHLINNTDQPMVVDYQHQQEPFLQWQNYSVFREDDSIFVKRQENLLKEWKNFDTSAVNVVVESEGLVQLKSEWYNEDEWRKPCKLVPRGNVSFQSNDIHYSTADGAGYSSSFTSIFLWVLTIIAWNYL